MPTILGSHDVVVVARRRRKHGPIHRTGPWEPVGVVGDARLAGVMAELLAEEDPELEVATLTRADMLRRLGTEERERVVEAVTNRRRGDLAREERLRRAALALLAGERNRRSGADRRSGRDRRVAVVRRYIPERRSGLERRSGDDRRSAGPGAAGAPGRAA